MSLLRGGEYRSALACYQGGLRAATAQGDRKYRLVFLSGAGSCQSALYRYRAAIATLNKASELAREISWNEYVVVNATLLASIYMRLGDFDLAYSEAARGLAVLADAKYAHTRAQLLFAIAEIKYLTGDKAEAKRTFDSGMAEAKRGGEQAIIADALNRMGRSMLEKGDLGDAERMLSEALEIRLARSLPGIDASYRNLGTLRLLQHKPEAALEYFDHAALAAQRGGSRVPLWAIYFGRGQALRLAGRLESALDSLQLAISDIRRRRDDIVPAEEILVNADANYDQAYTAYVETAMQVFEQHHNRGLLARAFAASEENRAMSIRQSRAWRERLPQRYWDVLAETRTVEIAAVSNPTAARDLRLRALHAELARMEAVAGLQLPQENSENSRQPAALVTIQRSLRPGEALLSFHMGSGSSYLWTVTTRGLDVRRLPAREHLASRIAAFRAAVTGNSPGLNRAAADLYAEVFPHLPEAVRSAGKWVLSLDDTLFELPFAALRDQRRYLVERHSLRIVPSAYMLRERVAPARNGSFVAVADPVYNRADSRWRFEARPAQPSGNWFSQLFSKTNVERTPAIELSRIPSSAIEARACAQEWTAGTTTILTGVDANRTRVAEELAKTPAVAHFSVHVIAPEPSGQRAYVALALQRDGTPDLMTPTEISRRELDVPLIVLSGCSSGRGRALPGAGLTGLTRAWLLSGAYAVAASNWPTPDDTGGLFRSFYRSLRSRFPAIDAKTCAEALRQAQIEMLQSGTWRSQPRYWAAFFLVGRN